MSTPSALVPPEPTLDLVASIPNKVSYRSNESPDVTANVKCIAWRATAECDPDGSRLHESMFRLTVGTSRACDEKIPIFGSGYCEMENSLGERIHVFKRSCREGYPRIQQFLPHFSCQMAASFLSYKDRLLQYEPSQQITTNVSYTYPTRGIVIQIYPGVLASVFSIVRLLRDVYGCQLHIELWTQPGEFDKDLPVMQKLLAYPNIQLRFVEDSSFKGYMSKVYSIAYSQFDQVLFLDSDNYPARDPTFLFDSAEFQENGSIFWRDLWSPSRNDFFLTQGSVVWELFGIPVGSPIRTEMEMESGQLVIDRRTAKKALKASLFMAKTFDEIIGSLGLLLGDKDVLRLSWYLTETPFHYVEQPPGVAGFKVLPYLSSNGVCGLTMVQADLQGEPLFFHRAAAKINDDGSGLVPIWQAGFKFVGSNRDSGYAMTLFYSVWRLKMCFHPHSSARGHFEKIDYQDSQIELLEKRVLTFARQALELMGK